MVIGLYGQNGLLVTTINVALNVNIVQDVVITPHLKHQEKLALEIVRKTQFVARNFPNVKKVRLDVWSESIL
jgi:hypothetical protein